MTVFEYMMQERERLEKESDDAFQHLLEVFKKDHTDTEREEAKTDYIKKSERHLEVVGLMSDMIEKGLI